MLKHIKKTLKTTMSLIMLLSLTQTAQTKAEEKSEITIHINQQSEEKTINIWKIKNKKEKSELEKELAEKSKEELDKENGEAEEKTSKEHKIKLSLEKGTYYIKEKGKNKEEKQLVPTILTIPTNEKEIYIKEYNEKKTGSYRFKKISSKTKEGLAKAKFKITREENQKQKAIEKEGKEATITSDQNGEFIVEDLEYGEYNLWEIEAPEGYKKLEKPIKFTISEKSITEEKIEIKNDPKGPPPLIEIPNTGDIIFIVLTIGGIIIFLTGYKIVREKD